MSEKILDTQSLRAVKKFVEDSIAGNYKDSREFLYVSNSNECFHTTRNIQLSFALNVHAWRISKGIRDGYWNKKKYSHLFATKQGDEGLTLYGDYPLIEVPSYTYASDRIITYKEILAKVFQVEESSISSRLKETWGSKLGVLWQANDKDSIYLIPFEATVEDAGEVSPNNITMQYLAEFSAFTDFKDVKGFYKYNRHIAIQFIDNVRYFKDENNILYSWRGKISDIYLDLECCPYYENGTHYLAVYPHPRLIGTEYPKNRQ